MCIRDSFHIQTAGRSVEEDPAGGQHGKGVHPLRNAIARSIAPDKRIIVVGRDVFARSKTIIAVGSVSRSARNRSISAAGDVGVAAPNDGSVAAVLVVGSTPDEGKGSTAWNAVAPSASDGCSVVGN